jgi:hypothetical protein
LELSTEPQERNSSIGRIPTHLTLSTLSHLVLPSFFFVSSINQIMGGNPCFALLWLIVLVFIAWPVAGFASGIWIFLQPFEACFGCIGDCRYVPFCGNQLDLLIGKTKTFLQLYGTALSSKILSRGLENVDELFAIAAALALNHEDSIQFSISQI